jgi:hypothetical protein
VAVAPTPWNTSYLTTWSIGDDGTGAATGFWLVKLTPTNDQVVMVDLTPALTAHNGRTLHTISPTFAVAQVHIAVPAITPTIRCYRSQSLRVTGVAPAVGVSLLSSTDSAFPPPGTAAAYDASGHWQSWSMVTDQNNVIDTTQYRYSVVLFDESGAGSLPGNLYQGFVLGLI